MNKRSAMIGSMVLAVAALLAFVFLRTQTSVRRPSAAPQSPQRSGVAATSVQTSLQESGHVPTTTNPVTGTPKAYRAQEIIGILLHARPGSLTTEQAHQLVKELTALPDFDAAIHPLIISESVPERLFAVYVLLQKSGLTAATRALALSDASPYVRAEVARWLFRKQDFETLESLIRETASRLEPESIGAILSLAPAKPKADVPMPLSRLRIGEGLPTYLTLLAQRSTNLTVAVYTSLGEVQTPPAGKKVMLQVLAAVRPPNYADMLECRLNAEHDLATRALLAQYLAATISESDLPRRQHVESSLPTVQAGLEPVALQYREQRLSRLRELDAQWAAIRNGATRNPLRLQSLIDEYLAVGRLVDPTYISVETLNSVAEFAVTNSLTLRDNSIAEVRFEVRRIQNCRATTRPAP